MEKTIYSSSYKALQDWLKEQRKVKSITQRQLAQLLEVPHSWVGKVETGERRLDVIEFCRICKVMDIDPHDAIKECSLHL